MDDDKLKAALITRYLEDGPVRFPTCRLPFSRVPMPDPKDLLVVEPLPTGALAIYDKDPDVTAFILDADED